jgi:endonuclease YncB( thermonuclease family)
MTYRNWRFAIMNRVGALRLTLLLAVAVSLAGWHFFETTGASHRYLPISMTSIVGYARVIDGDTIDISGKRIRLYGIDAPEAAQTCVIAGQTYRCGETATRALIDLVRDRTVQCEPTGLDRYQRTIARCKVQGNNTDINAWLVRKGLAVAYRRYSYEYITDELGARIAQRGVWAGTFQMPWDYRAETRGQNIRFPRQ